jgi:hypothetical protein
MDIYVLPTLKSGGYQHLPSWQLLSRHTVSGLTNKHVLDYKVMHVCVYEQDSKCLELKVVLDQML